MLLNKDLTSFETSSLSSFKDGKVENFLEKVSISLIVYAFLHRFQTIWNHLSSIVSILVSSVTGWNLLLSLDLSADVKKHGFYQFLTIWHFDY